jgi:hypothetical protein
MGLELIVWGVCPALLGGALISASVSLSARRRTLPQVLLSVGTVTLCVYALWVLWRIFVLGAWPTFVPHLLIGISVALYVLQVVFHRRTL